MFKNLANNEGVLIIQEIADQCNLSNLPENANNLLFRKKSDYNFFYMVIDFCNILFTGLVLCVRDNWNGDLSRPRS